MSATDVNPLPEDEGDRAQQAPPPTSNDGADPQLTLVDEPTADDLPAQFSLRALLAMTAGFSVLFAVLHLLGIDALGTIMAFVGSVFGAGVAIVIVDLFRFSRYRTPQAFWPPARTPTAATILKTCPQCGQELAPWADRCFACGGTTSQRQLP
jgi:hypothetical protein